MSNTNKNVLHVIDSLGLGGAQTIVKGIFEAQPENGNIFLYALRKRKINIGIKHRNNFTYKSKSRLSPFPLLKIRKIVKEESIQTLHCHLFRSQVFGWLLKKLFFAEIKLIFHEHGQILKKKCYYDVCTKIMKGDVALYIAVSHAIKNKLIKTAGINPNKAVVLHNFVDLNRFHIKQNFNKGREKEKLGFKKKEYVVGFAGRIIKMKGWGEFARAAAILTRKHPQIKFVIAGDGVDKNRMLGLLEKLDVKNHVKYMGFVSDMNFFYNLIDCLVIPSHWEAMGIVAIEAQAVGVPVIASNVCGLNEIVINKRNGLLFEPKNERDLAKKIGFMYKNRKLRDTIIENGTKRVKKYSLSNYLVKLEERVYGEL